MNRRGEPWTECGLFYDGLQPLLAGDFLLTPAGSAYRVERVHVNRNRPYRQQLRCLRWPPEEIPVGAKVFPLHWYPRKRKRGRTLASLPVQIHGGRA
jgi:hypothetical protein